MKLHITASHIKGGRKRSHSKCPIALALRDNGYITSQVGPISVRFFDENSSYIKRLLDICAHEYLMTSKVFHWIDQYDKTGEANPCTLQFIGQHVYLMEGG